jgi:predicted small secreted protein
MVCGLLAGALAALLLGGCSTVAGFSQFVGGVARDIGDAAEGTRDHMAKNGPHR